jgi:hypothetical protein
MGVIATFDYSAWSARYPEFSNVLQPQAQAFWTEAGVYHANGGTGPVSDAGMQALLMGMLTAHIAFLGVGTAGNPSPSSQGIVGRITSASMGPVSVSADLQGVPGTAAWYGTSVYGLADWQATAAYRTMNYRRYCGFRR